MTDSPRDRILQTAARLLAEGGRDAVTTRAVSAEAGVQPQTIYRQFGDMRGLLAAVASLGFAAYLESKRAQETDGDPVARLRAGWDTHVEFGLANPALYTLMYGDPHPETEFPAAREGREILRGMVQRLAEAGRLRLGVDAAAAMIHAAGVGVVLALLAEPDSPPELSESVREAVLAAIVAPEGGAQGGHGVTGLEVVATRAIGLKAVLPDAHGKLTPGETALFAELLDRLS